MTDRVFLLGGLVALALGLFGLTLASTGAWPSLALAVPQPGRSTPAVTSVVVGSEGLREFRLEAVETTHELRPGLRVPAWSFNGQVPGPEIRVREGERVRIVFTNRLPVETAIHWHGLHVPNAMDGVPHVTQPPVKPGESFVYEFEAKPAGTHIYHVHSHGDGARQLDMGLAGPFIVEPATPETYDREYTLMLDGWAVQGAGPAPVGGDDGGNMMGRMMGPMMGSGLFNTAARYNVFTLNGKAGPAVQPLVLREGERVKLRLINVDFQKHVLHLHGHRVRVTHADGHPLPEPQAVEVVRIAPFERYDLEFVADNPGEWELHDHNPGRTQAGLRAVIRYEGAAQQASSVSPSEVEPSPSPRSSGPKYAELVAGAPGQPKERPDRTYDVQIHHTMSSWTINGKSYPNTDPLWVREGERVRLRLFNMSPESHPMHLHGHYFQVVAVGAQRLAEPWLVKDVLNLDPMESYEVEFLADNPGVWMFHCHQQHHADHGLIILIRYL